MHKAFLACTIIGSTPSVLGRLLCPSQYTTALQNAPLCLHASALSVLIPLDCCDAAMHSIPFLVIAQCLHTCSHALFKVQGVPIFIYAALCPKTNFTYNGHVRMILIIYESRSPGQAKLEPGPG